MKVSRIFPLGIVLTMLCGTLAPFSIFAAEKPNIVLFYIDDWAWNGTPVPMDASMENSRMPALQMPNLERLASQGMTFRNAYGSPRAIFLFVASRCDHRFPS
ncbi:MAG: hypothetical protein OXJ37_12710, partial [Bryobacterales bacterium]|nr:hypothetical protein [Bryobacterales bacterium]